MNRYRRGKSLSGGCVGARTTGSGRRGRKIARLMESGLDFVAADFPYANKFTVHVLAAVAEYESQISPNE
jgi:hypothetical protein